MQEGEKIRQSGVRRLLKWSMRIAMAFLFVLLLVYLLFLIPAVQSYTAQRTAAWLSSKSGTTVSIDNARFRLFNYFSLGDFHIADYNGVDTIISARSLDIRIRSINPFGPRLAVREVNLVDAQFNMNRALEGDFSFVRFVEAIGGSSDSESESDSASAPSASDGSNGGGGGAKLRIKLGGVRLTNVTYNHFDQRSPTSFSIHVPSGRIRVDQLDLAQKALDIRFIELENILADFSKDKAIVRDTPPPDSIHLTTGGWAFSAGKIDLSNARFLYDDQFASPDTSGAIDFAHLDVASIDIALESVRFVTDTITGVFNSASLVDHSGFDLQELKGEFYVSNEEIWIERLLCQTGNSQLSNRFGMYYGDFTYFSDFFENVRLDLALQDSRIAFEDLSYFAPDVFPSNEVIAIDGRIYGTIDNLKGRDIEMLYGKRSRFEGRMDIRGLPNFKESFIEFRMKNLRTEASDIYALLPDLELPSDLEKLGYFSAQGEFTGFPRDFVAYGNLQSGIGNLQSDVNMKIDDSGLASYSGNIDLDQFNLGLWTGQENSLGTVSLVSDIKGKGLSLDDLDVELNTDIAEMTVNDYTYNDLKFKGTIRKDFFEGALVTADPGFDQNFEGTIDFSSSAQPVFQFTSKINGIDLQAMNLTKSPLTLQGEMKLNLEGNHLDSIIGKAILNDLVVTDSADTYELDSLILIASEQDGERNLTLTTDLFSAAFTGEFVLSQMPNAIKGLIGHYFPGSGIRPDTVVIDQDLLFAVNIKDSRNFTKLISPEIGQIKNGNITGSFNSTRNQFDARAKFPEIEIGEQKMENLLVDIKTDNNELAIFTKTNRIYLTDSLYTPVTVIESNYARDSLFFNVFVGRDTDEDRLNLRGAVTAIDESFRFNILPSEIYTKNKRWEISPNNSLVYNYRSLIAEDFELSSGEQRISLTSLEREGFSSFLELDLTAVKIEEVFHAIRLDQLGMGGSVDGKVSIANVFEKPGFLGNLSVDDFYFNDVMIGDIQLNTSLQTPQNRLNFIASVKGENDIVANGGYYLNSDNTLEAEVNIRSLDISPFEQFLAGLVSGLDGDLSGRLVVSGSALEPDIDGSLLLTDAGFKIDYLGVPYTLPSLEVEALGDSIIFKPANIYDPQGNTGYLTNGGLYHVGFDKWWFDNITITTPNMLFMDNNREVSPELFGTAYGTGTVQLDGPLNDLDITVNAQSNKGTSISIPIYGARSVAGNDFINFINTSTTSASTTATEFYTSKVNFSFYLDITEDAMVELDIGDKLTGSGTGNLHIEINTLGDIRITGLYTVAQGKYAFSLQDLISKEFEIEKGGTITWTGDPYAALLDLRAIYNTRASTYDLLDESITATLSAEDQRKAQRRQDIKVYLELSGLLESPNIDFNIEVPEGQNAGISVVDRKLQEIESDKNELNRQVFGLLVFNRFIPDQSGFTPLFSGASTSVSEFLSKQLSGYFSDWLSQYVTDLDVNIGYRTYADNLSELGSEEELEVDLSKKFFNDRIYINLGGNFDLSNNDAGNSTTNGNVAGDFEIEYAITPDGRFRIRAFQRTDYDVIQERNYIETGVGVFYSQEFNSLYELISNRRKRRNMKKIAKDAGEEVGANN